MKEVYLFQYLQIVAFFSIVINPMIASIGKVNTTRPANTIPMRISGRSIRNASTFVIPQQALKANIISLKNTIIDAIVKSMIIAATSLSVLLSFVVTIVIPFCGELKSFNCKIECSNLFLSQLLYPLALVIFL